jgi:hypothetical protein
MGAPAEFPSLKASPTPATSFPFKIPPSICHIIFTQNNPINFYQTDPTIQSLRAASHHTSEYLLSCHQLPNPVIQECSLTLCRNWLRSHGFNACVRKIVHNNWGEYSFKSLDNVTLDDLCRDIGDKGLVLYLLRKNVSENCS